MVTPDQINGLYESLGGLFLWRNVWTLYKDKQVRGISIISTAFFMSWGFWNCFYYTNLNQWMSFYGGLVIVSANVTWVTQMMYYTYWRKERGTLLQRNG